MKLFSSLFNGCACNAPHTPHPSHTHPTLHTPPPHTHPTLHSPPHLPRTPTTPQHTHTPHLIYVTVTFVYIYIYIYNRKVDDRDKNKLPCLTSIQAKHYQSTVVTWTSYCITYIVLFISGLVIYCRAWSVRLSMHIFGIIYYLSCTGDIPLDPLVNNLEGCQVLSEISAFLSHS